ncbi:MAG: hypothetical protein GY938_31675, partial [Ketobacter sp.]|nr:hypothetical protein [Ketobacter sp.]
MKVDAKQTKEYQDLITEARKRYKLAFDADRESRRDGMDDMKFAVVPGEQWTTAQKKARGNRPCYEFNKIRVTGKRIINGMRDSRPAGKVIGTEDSDKDTAEVFEGLIRNIWTHGGDTITDNAAEYQVFAGYGAWRVNTDYVSDDVFEQDIILEPIPNPFNLFSDPTSLDVLKRDSGYWFLTSTITSEEFEEQYKGKEKCSFEESEFDDDGDWWEGDTVRITEYWYKKQTTKQIWQLKDGRVVDDITGISKANINRDREVKINEIWFTIMSGNAVLETPQKWAGTKFPFVPVYGEYYIIDGKTYWSGITRPAKDPQRSYNTSRTSVTETIAMAPQAKYWATPHQAEGHEEHWKTAHSHNYPFMLYNSDPEAPGAPPRMGSADIPIALIQESQISAEEINMVTGIYQADVGGASASTSGRHEIAKQHAGSLATFNYQDNLANAVEYTYEILIDLIPKVYDTQRSIRVLGADDAEKFVTVNAVGDDEVIAHDLTVGKYDVTVKTGPNFTTKRQEAADTYQGLLQGNPEMFPLIGDLIFKSMDLPYAEEIAQRLRVMAPEPIQQMLNDETELPPEGMAAMQQAEMAMGQVQEK